MYMKQDAPRLAKGPVIGCMNVKYSPNLGDGLIAECLEATLIAQGAGSATRSVDLAARDQYGQQMTGRGLVMSVLEMLPGPLRQGVVRVPLAIQSRRRWGPHYARELSGVSAMSIGGGNLLADLDLNFPTKVALALDHAAKHGLPVAIYACGMSGTWTREGLRRMRASLRRAPLQAVFLRDPASKAHWDELFAKDAGMMAEVVRDPGVLASEIWPHPRAKPSGAPRIGIGLMSQIAIKYHGTARLDGAGLTRWYLDLVRTLQDRGADVVAFTNGSPEDVAVANAMAPELEALGVPVQTPTTPADLAGLMASFDAIAAYRMHAIIAAYSYGVPAIALAWDSKLEGFMSSVERQDWLRDVADLPADQAADLLIKSAEDGVDEAMRRRAIAEARADIGRLVTVLTPS